MIRVVMHVVPGLGSGGAKRMAADSARTLYRERFEVGAISLPDPLGANLGEILTRNGITVGNLGKRRASDPRAFVRVARVLERFRFQVVHTPTDAARFILSPPLRRGMAHASR